MFQPSTALHHPNRPEIGRSGWRQWLAGLVMIKQCAVRL
jgi:hypothetical protein